MTYQEIQVMIRDLQEVRSEITCINQNAGETVFNPALTTSVDRMITNLTDMTQL
jgi:hypothetical protein